MSWLVCLDVFICLVICLTESFVPKLIIRKHLFSLTSLSYTTLAQDKNNIDATRTHDQCNATINDLDDRFWGVHNERRAIL